jgi:GTP-binding protein
VIRFADEAVIEVRSGKGGNGCVAFRREKNVPAGGPAGGDGGCGGSVVFVVQRNLRTLSHLRYKQLFKAKNGGDGEGSNRHGGNGGDIRIPVPPGTILKDAATGEIVRDFASAQEDEPLVFLTGGKGGWGNTHFKSSVNQTPQYAHEGTAGEARMLAVELSVIADIALVGFPNAGKSSLLDYFTNARPKIAPYPFTTKIPNLGVLSYRGSYAWNDFPSGDSFRDIIIADIPGLIEGASEGVGLGIRFLKHASRASALLFIIDCADESCHVAYETLCREIGQYSAELVKKPRIVLCNKIDVAEADERAEAVRGAILHKNAGETVIPISIYTRRGLNEAKDAMVSLVERNDRLNSGADKGVSAFLATRAMVAADGAVQYPGTE